MREAHLLSKSIAPTDDSLKYWTRAFVLASMVHLTLPDVQQPGWMWAAVLEGLGILCLLRRASPLGFLLCFLGTLGPLLWCRDVLTQSMLLTWFAALGLLGSLRPRIDILESVRWVTAATYWLAAIHKLNSDFFTPDVSCAHHAWHQITAHWHQIPLPQDFGIELSVAIIFVEVLIGVLLVRRSLWLWPTALLFHWPLTITLAPAFGFVMLAGCSAGLTARQVVRIRTVLKNNRPGLALGTLLLLTLEAFFTGIMPGAAVLFKGAVFAVVFLAILATIMQGRPWDRRGFRFKSLLAKGVLTGWILHGMTPYVGIQYQHTAAMLSNLRIDADCHNSFIFPASWATPDGYIRFDQVSIGTGQRPKRERKLKNGLWSLTALATMHRNWCIDELRPIQMSGTWRHSTFKIPDLCEAHWYRALGMESLQWTGFQGFQKNLSRKCKSACIH
jgi:hypothetical protein